MNGLPRPVPFRKVTPLHAGADPVQHPVHHLPVIPPPAATPITHRQKRLQPLPLSIRQIISMSHRSINGSADRRDAALSQLLEAGKIPAVQPLPQLCGFLARQ
ncbi:hypothetical protein GCM10010371_63460 [Streptomyces subrutilus]|uniref:Uncharacterized protein n=1 Tax=Streptomyces subrutilus TaxID=36818 RepID=A0A918RDL5_9ACTN|nr:hypothetical protein GCM10010371_63460 [Streptomyces subrutilus]